MINEIFQILIFPGLLGAIGFGFFYEGLFRKITAHMHNRIGPPVWQPLLDWVKLMLKENINPEHAEKILFTLSPIISLASALTVIFFIPIGNFHLISFTGDLFLVIYLLSLSTICFAFAGFSSSSPFGSLGAIREITQFFAYEFPFIISLVIVGLFTGFKTLPFFAWQFPLATIAFLCSLQGKISLPPFHIPDAEQEIVAGPLTEYSGSRLAMFSLAKAIRLWVLISLTTVLFFGGGSLILFFAKSLIILFLLIVMRVIFARLRIDQSFKFYFWFLGPLALLDFVRVLFGYYW